MVYLGGGRGLFFVISCVARSVSLCVQMRKHRQAIKQTVPAQLGEEFREEVFRQYADIAPDMVIEYEPSRHGRLVMPPSPPSPAESSI